MGKAHVVLDAGFDLPDERDWLFGDIYMLETAKRDGIDSQMLSEDIQVFDQSDHEDTRMACGSFGAGHGSNTLNYLEKSDTFVMPREHRLEFVERVKPLHDARGWGDPIEVGSALQDQLKFMKEKGLISAYLKTISQDDMKVALNRGMPILTGSRRINRSKTRIKPYVARGYEGSAHLFVITGFDDGLEIGKKKGFWICMNSYGEETYDNGYFYVAYDDFNLLHYSKYALVDKRETDNYPARELKKEKIRKSTVDSPH